MEKQPDRSRFHATFNPKSFSVVLALIYVIFCGAYIVISSNVAARMSATIEYLHIIELVKGLVFIGVTGFLFLVIAYVLLRKIIVQQERIFWQQQALVASEGRAMASMFASSVAHDMNNILMAGQGYVDMVRRGMVTSHEIDAAEMGRAVESLMNLSRRFMEIGRSGGAVGESRRYDLAEVVDSITRLAPSHIKVRACTLGLHVDRPAPVMGSPELAGRMLMNLIINAAEAADIGGKIEVRLLRLNDAVRLEVHDSGPGIPEEERGKIFEHFYTTKPGGNGLGLMSVRVYAEEYGGTIEVTASDLGGACIRVTLPLAKD
jgi:signal transduction histidine kinase